MVVRNIIIPYYFETFKNNQTQVIFPSLELSHYINEVCKPF